MQTDLQKIMGMEFSEDKVQYLVYQMLKGLKVGGACMVAKAASMLRASPLWWGRGGLSMLVWKLAPLIHPPSLSVHPLRWYRPQGECFLYHGSGKGLGVTVLRRQRLCFSHERADVEC